MIRYGLVCEAGHAFDGWFRSSSDFDAQSEKGLLGCPACGSEKIEKALMAPSIRTGASKAEPEAVTAQPADPGVAPAAVAVVDEKHAKMREMLRELRTALTQNSEDVGDRFPEVARKMHSEEIEQRSIHGRATPEEARALAEEGVDITRLPPFPDEMN